MKGNVVALSEVKAPVLQEIEQSEVDEQTQALLRRRHGAALVMQREVRRQMNRKRAIVCIQREGRRYIAQKYGRLLALFCAPNNHFKRKRQSSLPSQGARESLP